MLNYVIPTSSAEGIQRRGRLKKANIPCQSSIANIFDT